MSTHPKPQQPRFLQNAAFRRHLGFQTASCAAGGRLKTAAIDSVNQTSGCRYVQRIGSPVCSKIRAFRFPPVPSLSSK
ncbi:hypothetical protein ACG2K1_10965 [Neisseria sp. 23W00296]|uniref:hypothetical protein n=1 Tax=unclassified Neisseria TaxID=2623750 RepID=UPI00034702B4